MSDRDNILDDLRPAAQNRAAIRAVQLFALAAGSYLLLLAIYLWRYVRDSWPGFLWSGLDITAHVMVSLIVFGVMCAISGLLNAVRSLPPKKNNKHQVILGVVGNLTVVIIFLLIVFAKVDFR
ncbi:hypothetical protein [Lewinella sp. W8]|uniref:hypothetical protein n=1 Tax=Lewinella sp. W8 TaxID=2528208 RepID=UPI0010683C7D|nr:hypothetical protein [Lewinella sp. W8]MTB49834.1 hypothetical protein [Lewinella sp. W8]